MFRVPTCQLAAILYALLATVGLAALLTVVDPLKYALIDGVQADEPALSALIGYVKQRFAIIAAYAVAIGVLALLLLRLEVTRASLSELLVTNSRWPFWIVFLATLLWISQAYVYPGHLLGGDTLAHVVRAEHFARTLKSGHLPIWDKDFYLGIPLLQFYPPLFVWLTAAVHLLIDDIATASKMVLLAANLVGALGVFLWVRALRLGRFAGLVGACVYIGSWGHGHLLLYQGTLPLALVMAVLPLCLLAIERLLSPSIASSRSTALLALCVAVLFYAHQAHALIAGIYLALYAAVRWATASRDVRAFLLLVAAATLGIVAAISTIVPFLAEQHWVVAAAGARLPELVWPTSDYLGSLLTWGNTRTSFGADSAAYLGYSGLALGLAAWLLVRRHGRRSLLLLLLFLFLLSLSLRGLFARDIIFTMLFLAPIAALGAEAMLQLQYRHVPALIIAALFLDLGIVAIQPVARTDKEHQVMAGQVMTGRYPNAHVLLAGVSQDGRVDMVVGPTGSLPALSDVAMLGGPHNQGATPVHNYLVVAAKLAERDLNSESKLDSDTAILLGSFDIAAIIGLGSRTMGLADHITPTKTVPGLGRVLEIEEHSPVIFAERLIAIESAALPDRPILWADSFWDDVNPTRDEVFSVTEHVLKTSDYSPGERSASAIVVRDVAPAAEPRPAAQAEASVPISLKQWSLSDFGLAAGIWSERAGWAQLAYPWYPSVVVFHNGHRVTPLQSAFGLMVVPVSVGENLYEIQPRLSALRHASNTIAMAGFLLIGLAMLRKLGSGWPRVGALRKAE
jgi:hypothetical protein